MKIEKLYDCVDKYMSRYVFGVIIIVDVEDVFFVFCLRIVC